MSDSRYTTTLFNCRDTNDGLTAKTSSRLMQANRSKAVAREKVYSCRCLAIVYNARTASSRLAQVVINNSSMTL